MGDGNSSVAVVIPTQNRRDVLRETLVRVKRAGVEESRIYIYVNGCTDGTEEMLQIEFPSVQTIISRQNVGACVARNEAIQACPSEFILGLDDDSWPLDPHFAEIIERGFSRWPRAVFLAGCIHDDRYPAGPVPRDHEAYRVRGFVGCGFALRRSRFLALGGFRPFFFYYHEEPEVSLRAYGQGGEVIFEPALAIFHARSETNRDRRFTTQIGLRNNLSACVLNEPFWLCCIHLARLTLKALRFSRRHHHGLVPLFAWREFIGRLPMLLRLRRPLGYRAWSNWYRLPPCPP